MENFNELDLPEKLSLIISDIKSLNKKVNYNENVSKALIWFIMFHRRLHAILFVMWVNTKSTGTYTLALC